MHTPEDAQQPSVGFLDVTVHFAVRVDTLEDFEAATLDEAAVNLAEWYDDGSADIFSDMSCGMQSVKVHVRENSSVKKIEE